MARRRYELTDKEWAIIEPLLPNKPRGVPRVDDRRVLNGILWRFRSGSPWAKIPERYGPSTTCVLVHQHGSTAKKGDHQIMAWDVPGAALPANSTLLSTLRDVLSACA